MSAKSAIVVPAGLVKLSAADVLLAIRVPAGTLSAIELPAQLGVDVHARGGGASSRRRWPRPCRAAAQV